MEGLILLIIYAVFSLLKAGAKKGREVQSPRPKRPVLQDKKEIFDTLEKRFEELFFPEKVFPQKPKLKQPVPIPSRQREEVPAAKPVEPAVPISQGEAPVSPSPLEPLFTGKNELVQGIILAQILGPPKSRRSGRPF